MIEIAWKLLSENVYDLHQQRFVIDFPGTKYLHSMTKQVLRDITLEEF